MKYYTVPPQPLNYQPLSSKLAKKEELGLKNQCEIQCARKRASHQLLPEFERAQCKSSNFKQQVGQSEGETPCATNNDAFTPGVMKANVAHAVHSTPVANDPSELELPDLVDSAIPKLSLSFTDCTSDYMGIDDYYVLLPLACLRT